MNKKIGLIKFKQLNRQRLAKLEDHLNATEIEDADERIWKERESIRGLCDELRVQRDKAIRDLTEAIRECDELKRQKHLAFQQIKRLEYFSNHSNYTAKKGF